MLGNVLLILFVSCSSSDLFYGCKRGEACLDKPDEWAQVLLCPDALQAGLNKGLAFGTPTKRQVSKRQVAKRLVSKRPVSKLQVYKTSGFKMSGFKTSSF